MSIPPDSGEVKAGCPSGRSCRFCKFYDKNKKECLVVLALKSLALGKWSVAR